MSVNEKTASLLASLTSLPGKDDESISASPFHDNDDDEEDDALPSLAVEDVAEVPPPSLPPSSQTTQMNSSESIARKTDIENDTESRVPEANHSRMNQGSSNRLGGSVLLSSSGLLHRDSDGGGLFDDIDQEEEEESARLEREQKQRKAEMEEELRREKEAADRSKIQLQKESQARAEQEILRQKQQQQQQEEEIARQRQNSQMYYSQQYHNQQQQQQQQQASYMNYESVMGSMQELNLNDEPVGNNMAVKTASLPYNSHVLYSNVQNGQQNQYSHLESTASLRNDNHMQYSNVHGPSASPYSSLPQGGQNAYSNVQGLRNENQYGNVHNPPYQPLQQPQPPPPHSHMSQVSGYGGASQVYSNANGNQMAQSQAYYQVSNGGASNMHVSVSSVPIPQPGVAAPATLPSSSSQLGASILSSRSPMRPATHATTLPPQGPGVPGGFSMYHNGNVPANVSPGAGSHTAPFVPQYDPSKFRPSFGPISVTDPILVQSPGVFSGPPHWTYAVVVRDVKKIEGQNQFSAVVSNVRRRFRHFVALEERLRDECRGAIMPPRPDKHTTRAIDEASTRQSAQFAMQRAIELETYLNALRLHPIAGNSQCLQMFLTLPDHLGIAWPEVSSSLLTRLTEAGTNTAVKVAEGTSAVISELNNENQIMAGEDNAELLALASSEGLRISGVLQSVPKIENAITIIGEQSQRMNTVGMELQKLINTVLSHEKEYSGPFEVLSSGLLRSGRRTNRLAIELGAAAQVFTLQHKLCRYERLAFADRRAALIRRRDARKEADKKAQKLYMNQYSLQSMGNYGKLDGYGRDAAMSDEIATDAVRDADNIAHVLQCEVARVAQLRRRDWSMSIRVMVANLKEAHAERVAIWENCKKAMETCNSNENNWQDLQSHMQDASQNDQAYYSIE